MITTCPSICYIFFLIHSHAKHKNIVDHKHTSYDQQQDKFRPIRKIFDILIMKKFL